MCGIGGIVSTNNSKIDQNIANDMKVSLEHRGPDHSSINYISDSESVMFLDRKFYVPSPVQAYLKQLYGADWETPQQHKPSGVLPLFTQLILRPFVRFQLGASFSGADWCLEWRPWASRFLKQYGTQWAVYARYTHPE